MRRSLAALAVLVIAVLVLQRPAEPAGPSLQQQVNTLKAQVGTLQKQVKDLQWGLGTGGFERTNYGWGTAWDEIKRLHANLGSDTPSAVTAQRLNTLECRLRKAEGDRFAFC